MKKRIVILGAGESGAGAAVLAKRKGFDVFVSDKGKVEPGYRDLLQNENIEWEEAQHTEGRILEADEIIKSPGIPDTAGMVVKAREKNIPIISDIEFAGRYTNAKMIGITGTNGKTTTTLLTHHILEKAGLRAGLAGNVGKSFALQVAEDEKRPAAERKDHYVLELSSFQLDGMFDFRCNIAILTNITPDHLDRYDYKLENYVQSKFRILQNQEASDTFIYCADDALTMEHLPKAIPSQTYPFSIKKKLDKGAWLERDEATQTESIIQILTHNKPFTMLIQDLALQGKHNIYNSMAAGIAARVLDLRNENVRESLSDFRNMEHRLEFVMSVHGIDFVNDSKATNINSTWYALESFNKPIVLILGGVDKGNDYAMLEDLIKQKVKAIVCLGLDTKKIHKAYKGMVQEIVDVTSASDAVKESYRLARQGDVVLLSPACASFDLFEDYEDRGRQFKAAVRAL